MAKSLEMHPSLSENDAHKKKIRKKRTEEYARLLGEEEENPDTGWIGRLAGQDFEIDQMEKKNKKLQIDELTGLMKRELFDPTMKKFMEMIVRNHREGSQRAEGFGYTKLGLIFLDVNKFKSLNDTLGHNAGDKALKKVADVLKETLRGNDIVCRWGGDEFVVCLLGADEKGIMEVIEKLKAAMQDAFSEMFGEDYLEGRPPVSMGFSIFRGKVEKSVDDSYKELVKQADKGMYADKKRTRRDIEG